MRRQCIALIGPMILGLAGAAWGERLAALDSPGDSAGGRNPSQILRLDIVDDYHAASNDAPQTLEFAFGIGWSNLGIGGSNSELNSESLIKFDPVLSIAPFTAVPPLRVGFAFGVGLDLDNSQRIVVSNENGLFVAGSSDIPLYVLEPEFRLSWRQYFGEGRIFYIEPGVGIGLIYAQLDLEDEAGKSFSESDSSVMGRAFINMAWRQGVGAAGLQVSYMKGESLDLAVNAAGDVDEFYVGFFGTIRF
jgi:hypothetical protein